MKDVTLKKITKKLCDHVCGKEAWHIMEIFNLFEDYILTNNVEHITECVSELYDMLKEIKEYNVKGRVIPYDNIKYLVDDISSHSELNKITARKIVINWTNRTTGYRSISYYNISDAIMTKCTDHIDQQDIRLAMYSMIMNIVEYTMVSSEEVRIEKINDSINLLEEVM